MSGIAALLERRGNPLGRDHIEKVSYALTPYGRQRRDVHLDDALGLVHTGFVNTPEARLDRQPVSGAEGRFLLLFDGRLDNRDDLVDALDLPAEDARQAPDSRLAALSWERWGAESALRWVGEFAVLVWDARAATLTALVDPFGRRQLVYAITPDLAVVGSAAGALFAAGVVERVIDRRAMADHLGRLLPEPGRTFHQGVRRVPAGHILSVSADRVAERPYYRLTPGEPLRLASDEEYIEAGTELLEKVVRAQTRSAGAVATDLSGGLDSTLVAAQAARLVPGAAAIPAFTTQASADDTLDLPPGHVADESGRILAMLERFPRLSPVPLAARGAGWDRTAETAFDLAEMPSASAAFSELLTRKMESARDLGVTTLLTGHPGNLSLSWYGRGLFVELFRSLRWGQLARELRLDKDEARGLGARLFRYLLRPMLPRRLLALASRTRDGALGEPAWRRFSLIAPGFAAEQDLEARAWESVAPYDASSDLRTAADRAAFLSELSHGHAATGLQMTRAAYGIEIRGPLWDRRIVEWSLRVPEAQYRRDGVDRWLARRIAARTLPATVAWNRMRGLQDASWHSRIAAELPRLREQVRTLAEDPETAEMIDTERMDAILANWDACRPDRIRPHQRYLLAVGLQKTIHAGRFVRWVRGANR